MLVEHLHEPEVAPALMVRFELAVLAELGFGLDLTQCAATGSNDALIYVSPRTGRAVSASAGEPYRDRLLHLGVRHWLAPQRLALDTGLGQQNGSERPGRFLAINLNFFDLN